MSTIFHVLAALATISSTFVSAANDWSVACSGSCAYESGDGSNTAWSTIVIVCLFNFIYFHHFQMVFFFRRMEHQKLYQT